MTPALTPFDNRLGCEKPLPWNLRSTTNSKLSYADDNPAFCRMWADPYDDEDTCSITSSSVKSFDETAISTNVEKSCQKDTSKKVHFDPFVKIKCINKVSRRDAKRIWYSPLEMILLRKECIFTLWFLSAENVSHSDPSSLDSDRYCLRGLEAQRDQLRGHRTQVRQESLSAVLNEQKACRAGCSMRGKDDISGWSGNNNQECILNISQVDEPVLKFDDKEQHREFKNNDHDVLHLQHETIVAEKYAKASDPAKQAALLQGFEDEQVMAYAISQSRVSYYA